MEIANRIGEMLRARRLTLGTAESCTGGYIAHLITRVPGSSDYFLGSVVSYSNEVGPGGGTPEKPVGTVWIAAATPDGLRSHCFHFGTEREDNIRQAAEAALRMLEEMLQCE